jgi:hypothetical protein
MTVDSAGSADSRLWPGRADVPAGPLHLWYDAAGDPALGADGSFLTLASTTASPDAADAPPGASPRRFDGFAALLAEVPAGAGIVLDAATAARRVLSPQAVAALRADGAPRGDEPDLVASPVPAHLVPGVDAATAASAAAGVKHVAAAWAARPGGPAALLVMLSARPDRPASVAALDAAAAAVARHAPAEPVRVVMTSVLGVGRAVSFAKAGRPRTREEAPRRGRTGYNVLLALAAALLGAAVVSVPHWAGWHGASAVPAYVVGALIVVAGVGAAFLDAVHRDK